VILTSSAFKRTVDLPIALQSTSLGANDWLVISVFSINLGESADINLVQFTALALAVNFTITNPVDGLGYVAIYKDYADVATVTPASKTAVFKLALTVPATTLENALCTPIIFPLTARGKSDTSIKEPGTYYVVASNNTNQVLQLSVSGAARLSML
jgi:hypothetical protein